jgi:hypothetical protein
VALLEPDLGFAACAISLVFENLASILIQFFEIARFFLDHADALDVGFLASCLRNERGLLPPLLAVVHVRIGELLALRLFATRPSSITSFLTHLAFKNVYN